MKLHSQRTHDVIVPTFGRPAALANLLQALDGQTVRPDRVLVVDDTLDDSVAAVVAEFGFAEYYRNPGPRGSGISRNHGIALTQGNLVTFFDDDVLPAPDYLQRVQETLQAQPQALGAMGFVEGYARMGRIKTAIARLFMLNRRTATDVRLLPNLNTCYPLDLAAPIACDWLWGCNMTVPREVLDRVRFDPQFVRYSLKEDIKLALDARKTFPGRRFLMIPGARVTEQRSEAGRLAPSDVSRMNVIHRHYILARHGLRPRGGALALAWSDFGSLLVYAAAKPREFPGRAWGIMRGWGAVVRHRKALHVGDLAPLNAGYRFAKADR